MYEFLKGILLEILRCPRTPPEAPAGSHESVQVFRAAPAFFWYRLLGVGAGLITFVLLEVVGIVVLASYGKLWALLLAVALFLFVIAKVLALLIGVRLDYEMRYYVITDRSLRIREGVWIVREITLTFANIQNMKIEQGPIQRLFKVYDLVVETAGGGGAVDAEQPGKSNLMHQGVFRGLGRPQELRDLILRYLRATRTSGLGDHDDSHHPAPAPPPAGFLLGPSELQALRLIADETAAWRRELTQSA